MDIFMQHDIQELSRVVKNLLSFIQHFFSFTLDVYIYMYGHSLCCIHSRTCSLSVHIYGSIQVSVSVFHCLMSICTCISL